jgi:hypothetical protein
MLAVVMPARRRVSGRKKSRKFRASAPAENRASEALTIAWTVSVTGVVIADLMLAAAHVYLRSRPEGQPARILEIILLLSAAAMGAISLALLPAVWRLRRLKPPPGYVLFAIAVSAAPIALTLARLLG